MILIGLAGQARSGKNTVADYLCRRYGFIQFAFSDALYFEVSQAFGVSIDLLRGETKEQPNSLLALQNCQDRDFVPIACKWISDNAMWGAGMPDSMTDETFPLSPRTVLQLWGTEYRRAQDENYWIKKAAEFIDAVHASARFPEQKQQYFVETGTRFENERAFIKSVDGGNVWHIHRDGIEAPGQGHVSATPLPVLEGERQLWNNDTIERLYGGVNLLLSTSAEFVRVDPMLPDEEPPEDLSEATLEGGNEAIVEPAYAIPEEVLPGGQYYSIQADGHKMLCNADGTRSIFDDVDE